MENFGELFQEANWKSEKHVPVIDGPDTVKRNEMATFTVTIGKEIAHPNTTEHHIVWIEVYFHPEGEKFPYQIGKADFIAHGASVRGPDTSGVYTHHGVSMTFKTERPGTIYATSLCNIHGLWRHQKYINVE